MIKLNVFKSVLKINKIAYLQSVTVTSDIEEISLPFYELVFVQKGSISCNYNDKSVIVEQNNMLLIPANTLHEYTVTNSSYKTEIVLIGFDCMSKQLDILSLRPINIPFSNQDHIYRALKEISIISEPFHELRTFVRNNNTNPFCAEQLVCHDLEYLFIMAIRTEQLNVNFLKTLKRQNYYYKEELVPKIIDYINKHIFDSISVTDLCEEFLINRTSLYKIFTESQGQTLNKYINRQKIQTAKKMIREGNKNFTEIAELLSFSSIHYFCKVFIKYVNMTPTEYSKTIASYTEKTR